MMKSILRTFKHYFTKRFEPDLMLREMLRSLVMTQEHEISCDEVFAVLDQFAEAVQRGENPLIFMPLVRKHLDKCPDCREEYEALLRMLQPAFD